MRPRRLRQSMIIAVVVLGALVRLVRLGEIPPALFRDEAEKLYNAFCLATTGRDASGHAWPLFIEVFGVTTSAIYQYAALPFVRILGLGPWAARLPAATVGVLTLLVTFFWVERAHGLRAARWAALLLAISPWHTIFSRWAQQGIFLPLWLALGMLGWEAFVRGRRWGILLTAVAWGGAIYTYDVARAFLPLLALATAWLYRRELVRRWRETVLGIGVLVLVLLPTLRLLLFHTAAAQARFARISIFQSGLSWWEIAERFLSNYFSHWSPSFLLMRGDAELRHGVGLGVLTPVEFIGLVAGVAVCAVRRHPRDLLLLAWLAAFPVAASLTREGIPHALRTIVALPAMQVVAALGLSTCERQFRAGRWRRWFREAATVAAICAFLPFAVRYYGAYRSQSALAWQYGIAEALAMLRPAERYLDTIYFDRIFGAEYLVAVYAGIPPSQFDPHKDGAGKWRWGVFGATPEDWLLWRSRPVAVVTLPGIPGPPGAVAVAVHAPASDAVVLVIYLNPIARERLAR